MTTHLFIRHAKAGDRETWTRPDHLRPLTKAGHKQAEALVELLSGYEIANVLSSPYVRCVQTLEPLAAARGLTVQDCAALAEGAGTSAALDLITTRAEPAAMNTHGDVMESVLERLAEDGVPGADPDLCKKGSIWVLEVTGGAVTKATYLPPPA